MNDNIVRKNLFAIVKAFAKGTELSTSTISGRYYGNQAFLGDLRSGKIKSMTIRKIDEMLTKLSADWPEGVEWPQTAPISMARPDPKRKNSVKSPA